MRVFSLMDFKLEGANLIEASAGTGKTYTISALFLRLILEKGLPVSEVLVVTFTRAATAELKQRLRNALVSAQRYIQTRTCSDDTLQSLFEKALAVTDESTFEGRVNTALRAFDEAAIFTIHGFCQRAIKNNALLANSAFELELSANANEIYEAVIFDYWRQHLLTNPPVAKALQALNLLPDAGEQFSKFKVRNVWKEAIRQAIRSEGIPVEWDALPEPLNKADIERIGEIFAGESMKRYLSDFQRLMKDNGFDKRSIKDPLLFEKAREAWLSVSVDAPVDASAQYLGAEYYKNTLINKVKKGHTAPEYPAECEELSELYDRSSMTNLTPAINALRAFYEVAPSLYREKQKQLGVTTFDDMLLTLFDALRAPNGDELAQALCGQYKAALIDEFQDTDAIQYGIFRRIFMTAHVKESFVCFVGDPKQSIYRFRGADIQTYLMARDDIGQDKRFTLEKNYRSTEALIETVNRLFASETSFGEDRKIAYEAVRCGHMEKTGLKRGDQEMKALAVVTSETSPSETSAFDHVARTIVEYLSDETLTIDGARVEAKDIAILVRSQVQIQGMQRQLHHYGVQSRVVSQERIYDSEDAKEVEAVLRAVLNPRDLKTVKTALATRIIGCDAVTVYRVGVDEVGVTDERQTYNHWLLRFNAYRDAWEAKGAGYLLSTVMQEHHTVKRFLTESDGSRRLTNLYHLLELLYAMSVEYRLPEALLENFGKMTQTVIDLEEDSPEALRMESDDNIVTIMTYHKSKGLEFPIVFMPCAFKLGVSQQAHKFGTFEEFEDVAGVKRISVAQRKVGDKKTLYHPENSALQAHYLAEQLRLFYVAVTRASRRLEIVDESKNGVLTRYLINNDWDRLVQAGLAEAIVMSDEVKCEPTVAATANTQPASLVSLGTPGRERAWAMTSYSNMINRVDRDKDHHDEIVTPIKNADVVQALADLGVRDDDILFFPRGAEAGEALHQMLEMIDFTDDRQHDAMIDLAIDRYFPNEINADLYRAQSKQMINAILNVDLGQGWKLKDIDRSVRISELEFLLSMRSADIGSRLIDRIRREDRPGYRFAIPDGGHELEHLQGYLKGFMDLVVEVNGRYFILDWKSNFLSRTMPESTDEALNDFLVKNYSTEAMAEAIQSHGYVLQYLLYTVALHRLLKVRLSDRYDYDKHFGGVFYLFVRGVRPDLLIDGQACGVWQDRPSRQLIEDLDAILGSACDE